MDKKHAKSYRIQYFYMDDHSQYLSYITLWLNACDCLFILRYLFKRY